MLGIQIRKPRFNLYHLDEGEIFIKEFAANCQFVYPETETIENLQGVLIIASRSLIFEPDDNNFSMIKFHFRNIPDKPKILNLENKEVFKFMINKMIEIPKGKIIQPYITHEVKSDLFVSILHEKIEIVAQILYELFDRFFSKQNVFEFDSIEYLANLYSFKFDYTRIKSINEKFLIKKELFAKQILPLIEVPGLLMLTDARIYFQPIYALSAKKCYSYMYENTNKLFKRKLKLKDIGLEICTTKNKNLLLQFDTESERETIYDLIYKNTSSECETNFNIEKYTKLWVEGKLSNYDYLIALNSVANRTRNDLSQYPVFPWVIANYECSFLDLNDIKNFRDLSKPIGALNQKRLESFRERYRLMPDPKFLYGTHYSNPAYVIGYLVRKYPQFMLKLHGGRFDHPDRLFNSIDVDWHICLTNPASLKELTPEFYEENSEFLLNLNNIELGVNNKNEKINHVKLPMWANDPVDFLKKMREALESNYVSNHLHEWIDLIFGYKQTGPVSLDADNVFHPLTYENNTELTNTHDLISRRALEIQITEYGQTPKQIFSKPHPKRFTNKLSDNLMKENSIVQGLKQINFTEKDFELVQNLDENLLGASHINIKLPDENKSDMQVQKDLLDNDELEDNFKYEEKNYFENIESTVKFNVVSKYHKKKINTGLVQQEYNQILTAGEDGYLKIFDLEAQKAKRMHSISSIALTSMTLLNQPNIVALGSADNMIYIFNTIVGKQVNNFFAHEDTITKIFFSPSKNLLISNSNDSTYKIWDMSKNSKLPLNCFYDSDSAIVSADFKQTENLHICLNEDGNIFIRNIVNEKEFKKIRVPKKNFNFIKFNPLNKNQFFLSSQDCFKIYDIKEGREIDSIDAFANCVDIYLDSYKYLVTFPDSIKTYARNNYNFNKTEKLVFEYDEISFSNVCFYNDKFDNLIAGNNNGDLLYTINNPK